VSIAHFMCIKKISRHRAQHPRGMLYHFSFVTCHFFLVFCHTPKNRDDREHFFFASSPKSHGGGGCCQDEWVGENRPEVGVPLL